MVRMRREHEAAHASQRIFVLAMVTMAFVGPAGVDGQDPTAPDASVYAAAAAFLAKLGPTSVVDDYHCVRAWRGLYGVPVRCGPSPMARGVLQGLADALAAPLVDDVPMCDAPDGTEARSLQFSPVQYDSSEVAWFVATSSCSVVSRKMQRIYLVEMRRHEAAWVLYATRLLDETEWT